MKRRSHLPMRIFIWLLTATSILLLIAGGLLISYSAMSDPVAARKALPYGIAGNICLLSNLLVIPAILLCESRLKKAQERDNDDNHP